MINLYEWYEPFHRHFGLYGIYVLTVSAGASTSLDHVRTIGSKDVDFMRGGDDIQVEISLLAPDQKSVHDALAEGFEEEFELSLTSESYGINRDGLYETNLTFIQKQPQIEWVEL